MSENNKPKDARGTVLDVGDLVRYDVGYTIYRVLNFSRNGKNALIINKKGETRWAPTTRILWSKH